MAQGRSPACDHQWEGSRETASRFYRAEEGATAISDALADLGEQSSHLFTLAVRLGIYAADVVDVADRAYSEIEYGHPATSVMLDTLSKARPLDKRAAFLAWVVSHCRRDSEEFWDRIRVETSVLAKEVADAASDAHCRCRQVG